MGWWDMNWIDVAQNRNRWLELLNVVMKRRFHTGTSLPVQI